MGRSLPAVEQVADGVWSIPQPMPGTLGHSFVYAIELSDGVLLVDAGWRLPENLERLDEGLRVLGSSLDDVEGVLFTHSHSDHYGLAAGVRERSGAWLAMHEAEAALLEAESRHTPVSAELDRWFEDLGVEAGEREEYVGVVVRIHAGRPRTLPDRLLADGSVVSVDGCRLEVVHTPGHAPGHLCFVDRDRGVVFTGDHVLSHTTPNVSIFPDTHGNPLDDYLTSLARMQPLGELTAFPGHERRVPVGPRAAELVVHHDRQLAQARALVEEGHETVRAVAERMPWHIRWGKLGIVDRHLGLGETYAHLVVLEQRGELTRSGLRPVRWRSA